MSSLLTIHHRIITFMFYIMCHKVIYTYLLSFSTVYITYYTHTLTIYGAILLPTHHLITIPHYSCYSLSHRFFLSWCIVDVSTTFMHSLNLPPLTQSFPRSHTYINYLFPPHVSSLNHLLLHIYYFFSPLCHLLEITHILLVSFVHNNTLVYTLNFMHSIQLICMCTHISFFTSIHHQHSLLPFADFMYKIKIYYPVLKYIILRTRAFLLLLFPF